MAKITPAPGALFDGGTFRLYDNRLEVNKYGLFGGLKGFDVIYYSDVAGVTIKGKNLLVKKAAMKNAILLQFKKKDLAQQALTIINSNKA